MKLALAGLNHRPYPGIIIDQTKVYEMAKYVTGSDRHFCWLAIHEGKAVAALTALVEPMTFHRRKQASVIQLWTEKPGCGVKLMRLFLAWARAKPIIRAIVVTLEAGIDERIGTLLGRMGLTLQAPVYMETR